MTIRRQIARGYAFVLGIALVGTSVGVFVGQHFQAEALAMQELAIAERKILSDLQVRILYNRPTKQLSPYLGDREGLRTASQAMSDRVSHIQTLLDQHQQLRKTPEYIKHQRSVEAHAFDHQALEQKLIAYETDLIRFKNRLALFVNSVEANDYSTGDLTPQARQLMIEFVQGPEFAAFVQLPEDLIAITAQVEAEEQAASDALEQAIALQVRLIFGSLALSVAIATLIAQVTSREIAQPIKTLTTLTHHINKEQNFSLQVPVKAQGEVKSLTESFNQLIAQVNRLLSEVGQKNTDLEEALQQLNQRQMQLIQAEKMSSLGQLVAGVAHEINNPVNFIHGNLRHIRAYAQDLLHIVQLYQTHYPQPPLSIQEEMEDLDLAFIQNDLPEILESMKIGTHRIRQIVLSLRNFSRMDESEFKSVDIHEGLESTLLILQHQFNGSDSEPPITIQKDFDALPPVECAAGHLNQVFFNILENAVDALREKSIEGPTITIRTCQLGDDWVQVEIADNGPGMTEETKRRLFDPFFTTKPVGKGTGLSMSLSYQIITDRHQGKLECFSTLATGTALVIQIPCKQTTSEETSEAAPKPATRETSAGPVSENSAETIEQSPEQKAA
ncbi:MAG: ATP-binding protein [Cyanobacteria bacterium J06649_4]